MKKSFLLAPVFVMALSANASADLIVNGGFEADSWAPFTLGLDGNDVTGWHIPASDGTYPWGMHDGAFGSFTPYGEQFMVLGRWNFGVEYSIEQTVGGLTIGDTYSLGFAIASEQGCCSQLEVSFLAGSPTGSQVFFAPDSGSFWTVWQEFSMDFVADASSVTISFKNINPTFDGGIDLGLDNVTLEGQQVPEPMTLALLGVGAASIGLRSWRRRRPARS